MTSLVTVTSRQPQIGDSVNINYFGTFFTTKIISINGLTLNLEANSSLTWAWRNGNLNWLFPDNTIANVIGFNLITSNISNTNTIGTTIVNPTVVDVHANCIQPRYRDLKVWMSDSNNVYIGRRGIVFIDKIRFPPSDSKFANPFKVGTNGKDGTLQEVISKYRIHLQNKISTGEITPSTKDDLLSLQGKNLGCWCKSKHEQCHGDIIVEEVIKMAKMVNMTNL